jgi:hypothetical protein
MSANGESIKESDDLTRIKRVIAELVISELNFLLQISYLYQALQDESLLGPLKDLTNTARLASNIKAHTQRMLGHYHKLIDGPLAKVNEQLGLIQVVYAIEQNLNLLANDKKNAAAKIPASYFTTFALPSPSGTILSSETGYKDFAKNTIAIQSSDLARFVEFYNTSDFRESFLDLAYEAMLLNNTAQRVTNRDDAELQFHARPINDFLVTPSQRLGRYPLFAKELLKESSKVNAAREIFAIFDSRMMDMIQYYNNEVILYTQLNSIFHEHLDKMFFDGLSLSIASKGKTRQNIDIEVDIIFPCLTQIKGNKQKIPATVKKELKAFMRQSHIPMSTELKYQLASNPLKKLGLRVKLLFKKNATEEESHDRAGTGATQDTTASSVTLASRAGTLSSNPGEQGEQLSTTSKPPVVFKKAKTQNIPVQDHPLKQNSIMTEKERWNVSDKLDFMHDVLEKKYPGEADVLKILNKLDNKILYDKKLKRDDFLFLFVNLEDIYNQYFFIPATDKIDGHIGDIKAGLEVAKQLLETKEVKTILGNDQHLTKDV